MNVSPCGKWIHSGDWRLGQPIEGIRRTGDEALQTLAVEAPYRAVEGIVELALEQQASGLLLSGNLIDPVTCGAAALAFLEQVFESLRDGGVFVYWALGELDAAERWAVMPPWPSNVHIFPGTRWESIRVGASRERLELVGWSCPSRGVTPPACQAAPSPEVPRVAVVAAAPGSPTDPQNVAYWAAGGESASRTESHGRQVVRWPGTPQPRDVAACREESSVTLLACVEDQLHWHAHTVAPVVAVDRPCPTAWCSDGAERLAVRLQRDMEQLARRVAENLSEGAGVSDCHVLVRWSVESDRLADVWAYDPVWESSVLARLAPVRLNEERVVVYPAAIERPVEVGRRFDWSGRDRGLLGDLLGALDEIAGGTTDPTTNRTTDLARFARTLGLDPQNIRTMAASWAVAQLDQECPAAHAALDR